MHSIGLNHHQLITRDQLSRDRAAAAQSKVIAALRAQRRIAIEQRRMTRAVQRIVTIVPGV